MIKTSKGSLTKEEKDEKIRLARELHSELLNINDARDVDFNLKMPFMFGGVKVIGIFPSEFKKSNGFYLELIDSNLDPIDNSRTVYRINETDNYEHIYKITPTGQYAVPLEELDIAPKPIKAEKFKVDMKTLDAVKDENISNMTITDFAAIMLKSPISQKDWLNILIETTIKNKKK